MANFADAIAAGPSGPVSEATEVQDLIDLVDRRQAAVSIQIFDEEKAALAGGLLGPVGAMIGGLLAGASAIEGPRIAARL